MKGNPSQVRFPRAWLEGSWDFSFSGLKTAVYNYLRYENDRDVLESTDQEQVKSIAAAFQEAVIDVLVAKAIDAVIKTGVKTLSIGGGVASNTRLRERLELVCKKKGLDLVVPPPQLCVDNASMVGAAGFFNQKRAAHDWSISAQDCRIKGII